MTVSAEQLLSETMTPGEAMCPHRLVMEHVTSRWGVLVLIRLLDRPHRFSELRRAIGGYGRNVSEKMLTQTLQTLERGGLVHRDAKPVIPPRGDYSLTDAAWRSGRRGGWGRCRRRGRGTTPRKPGAIRADALGLSRRRECGRRSLGTHRAGRRMA